MHPLLESPVAGLIRWKAFGQIIPAGSRTEYPEDAVEDFPV